jgi:hypothetical protein
MGFSFEELRPYLIVYRDDFGRDGGSRILAGMVWEPRCGGEMGAKMDGF